MLRTFIYRLAKVIVRRPDFDFGNADPHKWHYTAKIDLPAAQVEHDEFCKTLKDHGIFFSILLAFCCIIFLKLISLLITNIGVEVYHHDSKLSDLADSIFVHDPVLITNKGVIQLRMGKPLRRGEEAALTKYINSLGVPTVSENIKLTLH